jgi:hypothetical protein
MDKYLLLFGFQFTQTVVLGVLDPALWRALASGEGLAARLDVDTIGILFQTLLSGMWIGRVAEFGTLLADSVGKTGALPIVLLAAQWVVLLGFLYAERRFLARRLAGLERSK